MRLDPNTELFQVGCNIRKWRQIRGIKQECLADELEISKVAMSKIETGKTDIPLRRLFSIARALGVKIQLLFTDPYIIIKDNSDLDHYYKETLIK